VSDKQETEVKLYIPDLHAVEQRLQSLGAHLSAPRVYERNVRYDDAEESLESAGSVLRLRQDTRARLTYKGKGSVEKGILSRTELEVEVSDFDTMDAILGKLGYHTAMIYEKYRTTYELDDVEIVLDEMPYGNFVEIEGDHPTIERLIERLELQDAPRIPASYTALFVRVKMALKLDVQDLTFDNFRGVAVPDNLFQS
jgi:adenylate cyclase, class 2